METSENNNDYAVYVIFTKDILTENQIVEKIITHSNDSSDILFCRNCLTKEKEQSNRYICCIKKTLYEHLINNCNF